MNILLISCYELGHQPFNLASPAAHLRRAGFEVTCLDLSVQPMEPDLVKQAQLVAFSTPMHTALRLATRYARTVRLLNPDCHICFYGLYAQLHASHLLRNTTREPVAHFVLGGEFEQGLVELARNLAHEKPPQTQVPHPGNQGHGGALPRQTFVLPDRSTLPPLRRYAHLQIGEEHRLAGYVEASRGCAHRCRHCPITPVYRGAVRLVQKEVVLADIEQLVEQGAQHITFGDPDFLNAVKHALAIVRTMHERFPEVTFDFTAKIEHLLEYRALLPELRHLGGLFVVSAVELLNDRILRYLDKGHTRADVEEAVRLTRAAGLTLRASLMPFTPWTQIQDLLDIFEFVETYEMHQQIDPIQYSIRMLVPVGSHLLNLLQLAPHLVGFDEETWVYQWRHPDPKMDELQTELFCLVEEASQQKEDNLVTYEKIRDRVFEAAGQTPSASSANNCARKRYAPRLTEDWFC